MYAHAHLRNGVCLHTLGYSFSEHLVRDICWCVVSWTIEHLDMIIKPLIRDETVLCVDVFIVFMNFVCTNFDCHTQMLLG